MTCQTYLCYCIAITHESLYYAAKAFDPLRDPLRCLRLVKRRIASGTLRTENDSSIARVPVEVWDIVKHKLVDLELAQAEEDFLDGWACPDCLGDSVANRSVFTWNDLCTKCDNFQDTSTIWDVAVTWSTKIVKARASF